MWPLTVLLSLEAGKLKLCQTILHTLIFSYYTVTGVLSCLLLLMNPACATVFSGRFGLGFAAQAAIMHLVRLLGFYRTVFSVLAAGPLSRRVTCFLAMPHGRVKESAVSPL